MEDYNIEKKNSINVDALSLQVDTIEILWALFEKIANYWNSNDDVEAMKSSFLIFISNRISIDLNYASYYSNTPKVITELTKEYKDDEVKALEFLLTNSFINISLPTTPISQTRQYVTNEFITLYLSLGGFKTFGSNKNYPGFFGGANTEDYIPYRIYEQIKESKQ